MIARKGNERRCVNGAPAAPHDGGVDRLAPLRIWYAEYDRLCDLWELQKNTLDFRWVDILGARNDHVVEAIADIDIAVLNVADGRGKTGAVGLELEFDR